MPLDRRAFLTLAAGTAAAAACARAAGARASVRLVRADDVRGVRRLGRPDRSLTVGAPGRCAARRATSWHGGLTLADVLESGPVSNRRSV